jgi:putative transposase
MPRQARIVLPDIAHHITQRGNYRQKVFGSDSDYKQYCEWVNEYSEEYKVAIIGYCLMSNHVHFIARPEKEDGLARLFNTLHMRYSQYINRRRRAKGHLWQGRFYSCLLDEQHLYRAVRYVENNPVRAKIVKKAWDHEWSSCKDHAGLREKPLVKTTEYKGTNKVDWKVYLEEEDEVLIADIRLKTQRGLAVGTEKFITKIESTLNRSLECLNPGRPKKEKE